MKLSHLMYKKTVISNVSCCQFYYKYKEYVRNKPSLCNPSKQLDNSYDVCIECPRPHGLNYVIIKI